jgi:hypothetical protein
MGYIVLFTVMIHLVIYVTDETKTLQISLLVEEI